MQKSLVLFILILPMLLFSADQANNLIYEGGNIQITSGINEYQNLSANVPVQGSIMVTHESASSIDVNSFKMGNDPLKVNFISTTPFSDHLVVTIYAFQLNGMSKGTHQLPSISVQVGGKEYQAPPITLEINK